MNSSYDPEADAYYFEDRDGGTAIRQISMGRRDVIADIDINGHIVGIEVL